MSYDEPFLGSSVLLVEDDIALADRINDLLDTLGYNDVLVANELGDAEEIAKSEDVDVALLDVCLADGLRTVELGRKLAAGGIRIVFMSGINAEEMALATRGFEFIEKPVSLPRLKAALQRAFVRMGRDVASSRISSGPA